MANSSIKREQNDEIEKIKIYYDREQNKMKQ